MILKYKEKYDDWLFIRHEDLSKDPIYGFKQIFGKLGLKFSEYEAKVINEHSQPGQ